MTSENGGTGVRAQTDKTALAALIVFIVAFIARFGYLIALKGSVLFDMLVVDAAFYDAWGSSIAAGDWLGGNKPFYDPPLYAYFLGVVYKILGHNLFLMRLVQIFIGSLHCVIIYLIGEKIGGKKTGLVAGLFAGLYLTFIFYDAAIMKAFMTATLVDAMMLAVLIAQERKKFSWWLAAGACLGLTIMLTVNLMIFAFIGGGLFVYFIFKADSTGRNKIAGWFGAWALGIALTIAPAAIRNYAVSGEFVLVSSYLGQNFYTGNNPYNPVGNYGRLPFVRANPKYEEEDFRKAAIGLTGNANMTPAQLSNFWMKESLKFIAQDPVSAVKRLALKFWIFWNRYETPDTYNLDFEANQFTPYLKLPFLNFGVVAPIGLIGMILAWPSRRKLWPLYIFLPVYMSTMLPFFVFDRYRLPAVGGLIVFAAIAIMETVALRAKPRKLIAVCVGCAVLAVLINLRPPGKVPDYEGFMNLAAIYRMKDEPDRSIEFYRRAIALNPGAWEGQYFIATVMREQGQYQEAVAEYAKAVKIAPHIDDPYIGIGMCLTALEGPEAAKNFYLAVLEKNKDLLKVRGFLIKLLEATDQKEAAAEQRAILRKAYPTYYEMFFNDGER